MEKIITYENLRSFCYSNDKLITGEIRAIVLEFVGLGVSTVHTTDPGDAIDYAAEGILYVIPYYNPWAWMNRVSVRLTDEIVAVLCQKYALDRETVKIVSTGQSMGGLSALVYCAYADITPAMCVTNCPVCDLVYHFTERPDLPRTLYSAFGEYDGTLNEALSTASPLHLADKMPDIPYTVFHCTEDKSVSFEKHALPFVEEMKVAHKIDLVRVPHRGHCDLPPEMRVAYKNSILKVLE